MEEKKVRDLIIERLIKKEDEENNVEKYKISVHLKNCDVDISDEDKDVYYIKGKLKINAYSTEIYVYNIELIVYKIYDDNGEIDLYLKDVLIEVSYSRWEFDRLNKLYNDIMDILHDNLNEIIKFYDNE